MTTPGNSTSFLINPCNFHILCSNLCYSFWHNRESAQSALFLLSMGYSWKYTYITNKGGWEYTSLKKPPGIFRFVTLTIEISNKKGVHPWKFCKILWHLLEVSRSKTKTHGNSRFFHEHTWENPGISTCSFFFFWNNPTYVSSSQNLIACITI